MLLVGCCQGAVVKGLLFRGLQSGFSRLFILSQPQQGVLPEDYRSQWCKDFFDNKGCPRGIHCPFAHNLQQLRIDAAIKTGTVREDFKQNFCADEHQKGTLCLLELPSWSCLLFVFPEMRKARKH